MRKYLIIILAAIALLWLASIVVYHEVIFQYLSGSIILLVSAVFYIGLLFFIIWVCR